MTQRLMAFQSVAGSAGQKPKTVVQARADLGRAHRADPCRRKLDCQWDAIEPPTDLTDVVAVAVDGKVRHDRPGALHEQFHRR